MPDLTLTPLAVTAFLATVVVMALTPGPDMVLYLGKAISQSRRAGLIAFAIAMVAMNYQTIKAALANPVESLRSE